jgi:two-component system LytT family sensor kinase
MSDTGREPVRPGRLALAVTVLWTLVAVVWGLQDSLAASLQGKPQPVSTAIAGALHLSLPWIPGTLAVIALALRFPLTRARLWPPLAVHLLALPLVTLGTNVLVVLGYWLRFGRYQGLEKLLTEGARWGLVRLHVAALLYAAAVALTQGAQSWQALRRRELQLARLETQLAQSRLQVLNAQIRPHFLFNTLHAIGQLWRSGRAEQAEALLDHLGALFQRVIASTARTQVPLREELQMVRDSLAIEQVRLGERLQAEIEAGEDALRCLVPPLILQPLVENAVKHGISPRADAGRLTVSARVAQGRLVVVVEDDGPGLAAGTPTAGLGTGLSNVRERLRALYGGDGVLDCGTNGTRGTKVRLEIPATTEEGHG